MRRIFALLNVALILVLLSQLFAQEPRDLSAQGVRVFAASPGRALTSPSQASPSSIVAAFLRAQRHSEETIRSLIPIAENRPERSDLVHVRMEQEISGLKVHGTYLKATVNHRGELVHLIENLADPAAAGLFHALIDERAALQATLGQLYPNLGADLTPVGRNGNTVSFADSGFFGRPPTVTRTAIAMNNATLEEGFLVETWSGRDNVLHHTLVGRTGRLLAAELRTNTDSYNIFPDHPGVTPQTVVSGPGAGNTESPSGWLSGAQNTVNIAGNNVHAYLDTDRNNAPDPGGTAVNNGNFLTAANLSQDPGTSQNKEVAVQNLFYFNNVIHDKLYRHGFNEAAGNFQANNFGKGGNGGDRVLAEAQDGSGTDNANFSTPSDGSSPRMQMFIWTQSSPNRDGDLDSDIIWHEYGHGLTWRMIGGMSGPMSGAIGEGMSDVLAILINNNDRVAEWSYNNPIGIRSAPYTNYSRTYGNMTGTSVHFDGEIYAATIWKLWQLFQTDGISQDTLFDYLIGGMNFTPSGPAMEDMRDGILQKAAGSGHECRIWDAFAHFGIGVGAKGQVKGGGPFGGGKLTVTESFQTPSECSAPPPPPTGESAHIGDLDGAASAANAGRWNATVTITVHDASHNPLANATVSGNWSDGANGSSSCTTDAGGRCSVSKNNLRGNSATFTVSGITASGFAYQAAANHDPETDSNGTVITVNKP